MTNRKATNSVLALPRAIKRAVALSIDIFFCALTVWMAFYLRLDQWVLLQGGQWLAVMIAIILSIPIFVVSGLYRAIFRYSGAAALTSIAQAALVYGLFYAAIITFAQIPGVPRTVGIIQPVLLFLFVAASRVIAAWWLGGAYQQLLDRQSRKPVLIYGAGSAGRQLSQALASSEMRVVGFMDDDELLQNRTILGLRIYPPAQLGDLVHRLDVHDVLLAIPSASRKRRNEILDMIGLLPVAVRTVPGLTDVAQGRVEMSELRELDVEDLLGREPVPPRQDLLERKIRGKVVLVSGAGGSIGSALCREILAHSPKSLLLVEMSEVSLYSIHQELQALAGNARADLVIPLLGSVCDVDRMRTIMQTWHPDTIYHAAAYKHVPLVEHNPAQGVGNNVVGTFTMAREAAKAGVSDFVFVSTDKAVRPTNVMGASKRLAEQVLQAMAGTGHGTCFSIVRFGNVLGSSGSVVPLFRRQIKSGGPVTITHPEITRYFMTIPEAAQLVIQAGAMAAGGEVFVLDMGAPVKIVDLARKMIQLAGLQVAEKQGGAGDIELSYVGLRPGEKLYEELLIGDHPEPTTHPRIMKANEHFIPWNVLAEQLLVLEQEIGRGDVPAVARRLRNLVPEYVPESRVTDWVVLRRSIDSGEGVAARAIA